MRYSLLLPLVVILLVSVTALYIFSEPVYSQNSMVNATVKISICGNLLTENGEDCDNSDLGNASCRSLGFDTGTLTCDIACDFDVSSCEGVAPVPNPTPSPSPSPSPSPLAVSSPSPSPGERESPEPLPELLTTVISDTYQLSPPQPRSQLPLFLVPFDLNGTGRIEITQVFEAVQIWVEDWKNSFLQNTPENQEAIATGRKKCDINNDKVCNLKDLSILLFYVEQ